MTMHPFLKIAIKAARRAGSIINRASLNPDCVVISQKGTRDLVTQIDCLAEEAIIDAIQAVYPQHNILAEESGHTRRNSEYTWVVDPLDGTTNFIHGLPLYAVSIAVLKGKQVIHGVVYDPSRNELFNASRGGGAFMNNRRLRVPRGARLSRALLSVRSSVQSYSDAEAVVLKRLSEACLGIRRSGAASLDLAYVAAGRLDGFLEKGLGTWDIAAGCLLVQEAGGLLSGLHPDEHYIETGNVLCGQPQVFNQISKLIRPTPIAEL